MHFLLEKKVILHPWLASKLPKVNWRISYLEITTLFWQEKEELNLLLQPFMAYHTALAPPLKVHKNVFLKLSFPYFLDDVENTLREHYFWWKKLFSIVKSGTRSWVVARRAESTITYNEFELWCVAGKQNISSFLWLPKISVILVYTKQNIQ